MKLFVTNLIVAFISYHFRFFHPTKKVASLDLNERKGSAQRYIPPHLRGSGETDETEEFPDPKLNDSNQGENFRENFNNTRGGGADRDFNNR